MPPLSTDAPICGLQADVTQDGVPVLKHLYLSVFVVNSVFNNTPIILVIKSALQKISPQIGHGTDNIMLNFFIRNILRVVNYEWNGEGG